MREVFGEARNRAEHRHSEQSSHRAAERAGGHSRLALGEGLLARD